MRKTLEKYRNTDWYDFSYLAQCMKLLFPNRQAELGLDDLAWQEMRKKLEEYRNTDWYYFSYLAQRMQILSAEEAYINDQGELVINMRKPKVDLHQEKPPMPVVRRF